MRAGAGGAAGSAGCAGPQGRGAAAASGRRHRAQQRLPYPPRREGWARLPARPLECMCVRFVRGGVETCVRFVREKGGVRGAAAAACRGSSREKDTFDHNERDNTSCIGRISPYVELRLREREPSTAQEQLRGEISLLTDKIGQFELERAAFAVREKALGAVLRSRVPCVLPSAAATAALCSRAAAGR